ncbi:MULTISPECIES: hypothetical protein [unclassified Alteromonas]|uniref:hypothetical protein n=1 Tax=unclassified Alteromonas TaxID=2614992 RepID=UPI000509625F|nr:MULTISPECIES: hypothetical protein [unclassified Alteromonas]
MLFKEKLLLSNCDSVRQLELGKIRQRFLTSLAFGDGVVLTPNTIFDNENIDSLIGRKNVHKYLNEEGKGKFVVRGFDVRPGFSLVSYFERLAPDYILSSLPASPRLADISQKQRDELLYRCENIQAALDSIEPPYENIQVNENALKNEIFSLINNDDILVDNNALKDSTQNQTVQKTGFFSNGDERAQFKEKAKGIVSRSQWYAFCDSYFHSDLTIASKFKLEVIDPSYNSLFVFKGEAFLQDNMGFMNNIPNIILDSSVAFKAIRNELKLIEYPIKAFELISSFGAGEIAKFLTDEAVSYIEDKFEDSGKQYLSRKNWFGMYNRLTKKVGLEIK